MYEFNYLHEVFDCGFPHILMFEDKWYNFEEKDPIHRILSWAEENLSGEFAVGVWSTLHIKMTAGHPIAPKAFKLASVDLRPQSPYAFAFVLAFELEADCILVKLSWPDGVF